MTHARLTRIEVDELDDELAAALAGIDNAALDGVPLRHHTGRTFQLECQDRHGEGPDEAVWLAYADGELVGYAALSLNRFANLDGAKVLGAVHPDHRRRGIGRALATAAEAATDRPRLRAPAWVGTAGEHAVPALGYVRSHSHHVRRLNLYDLPSPELVAAADEATRDYDVERIAGPCPDELLGDMKVLRETMNDAPEPGEPETFPPDRIRSEEESLARGHLTAYTVVARHRASGEPAGLSFVCVHELRPLIAAQEDTSVVRGHRGHRLGLRMKLDVLDWLRAERPDVESVDTWNAPENAPMIAINDALGCRVVAETIRFTRTRGAG